MTNWFHTHNINPIYGWGPSKRWIMQGGPTINAQCTMHNAQLELQALVDKARKAGCVYVEIRCFEDYSAYRPALEAAGFVYEPHYDVHIDPKKDVPEPKMRQIRAAMAEGQSWREVKISPSPAAQGEKTAIARGTWEKDIEDWYICLKKLYRTKVKRPMPSLDWFREMIVEKGCKLLVVEAKGTIIGGVLLAVEDDKSKAYEWYICGQVMSTWAAIDWCRQHGVRCFDTMGAGKPNVPYGVRDFKLQMGGKLYEFGRYKYIIHPWIYKVGEWVLHLLSKF